jgi:Membrane domain of glycerophosphoryl diester phosphodiesterase
MGQTSSIREAYAPLRGRVGRLALLLILVSIRLVGVVLLMLFAIGFAAGLGAAGFPLLAALMGFAGVIGSGLLWVWTMLRYAVSVPAAVLEDETATDAIRRSIELTRGSLLRVLVLLVFTMVITYAVLAVFQGPFMVAGAMAGPDSSTFFWMNLLGTITGAIGGAFTAPLMIVAFAVLYYDLRVRNEGLDLQLMLASLDAGATAPTPPALAPGEGR